MGSDSVQWDWKNGFCRKHAGQPAPCPKCIDSLDGDLVREGPIEEAKAAFLAGLGWAGQLTEAETRVLDAWRETQIQSCEREQAENRSHRMKSNVDVDLISLPKEEVVLANLANKQKVVDEIARNIDAIMSVSKYRRFVPAGYEHILVDKLIHSQDPWMAANAKPVEMEEWIASEDTAYKSLSLLCNMLCCRVSFIMKSVPMSALVRAAFFFERWRTLSAVVYHHLGDEGRYAFSMLKDSLSEYMGRATLKNGVVEYEGLQSVSYNLQTNVLTVHMDWGIRAKGNPISRERQKAAAFEHLYSNTSLAKMRKPTEEEILAHHQIHYGSMSSGRPSVQNLPITEDEWLGLEDRAFAALLDSDRRIIKSLLEDHPKVTASFAARVIFCINQARSITSLISGNWSPEQQAAYNALMSRG